MLTALLLLMLQTCPTTLDGLPMCPRVKRTAKQCLTTFPPDQGGGFCDWYGYATFAQEDRFERRRGFVRVKHAAGTGDTWRCVNVARCRAVPPPGWAKRDGRKDWWQ